MFSWGKGKDGCDEVRAQSAAEAAPAPGSPEVVYETLTDLDVPLILGVGGAVRDKILGIESKDVDVMVAGTTYDGLVDALQRLDSHGKAVALDVNGQLVGVRFYSDWTGPEGVEIALAREEISTGDGHQNFAIAPIVPPSGMENDPATLHQAAVTDLYRRDFTANAIGENIRTGELIDPLGGEADIRAGILRHVSQDTFRDDPLRVLRGMAAWSRYGLAPEPDTYAAMGAWAHATEGRAVIDRQTETTTGPDGHIVEQDFATIQWADGRTERIAQERRSGLPGALSVEQSAPPLPGLSWDRIRMEMEKVDKGANRADALAAMRDLGLWETTQPHLAPTIGFDQRNAFHPLTLDDHTLAVYGAAGKLKDVMPHADKVDFAVLSQATKLHDIGKVDGAVAKTEDGERIPLKDCPPEQVKTVGYYGLEIKNEDGTKTMVVDKHETISARQAEAAMRREAHEEKLIKDTTYVVAHHMFGDDEKFAELPDAKQGLRARRFVAKHGRLAETLVAMRLADRAGKSLQWDGQLDADTISLLHRVQQERATAPVLERADLKNKLGVDGGDFAKAGLKGKQIGDCMNHVVKMCVGQPQSATAEQVRTWIAAFARDAGVGR